MILLFDRLDALPDLAFAMWVAVRMVAIGLGIGAAMAAKRAWRWVGKARG